MLIANLLVRRGLEGGCGCLPDLGPGIRVPHGDERLYDLRAAVMKVAKVFCRIPAPGVDIFDLQVPQEPIDIRGNR